MVLSESKGGRAPMEPNEPSCGRAPRHGSDPYDVHGRMLSELWQIVGELMGDVHRRDAELCLECATVESWKRCRPCRERYAGFHERVRGRAGG